MTPTKVAAAQEGSAVNEGAGLTLFAQLLHALNQPLTGLQCSLELALSDKRTPEQYVDCMRGGLELTERMRNLVAAIRELLEIEAAQSEARERIDLCSLLRETLGELQPVAEAKRVRLSLDCRSLSVNAGRRGLTSTMFRVLESILSVAAPESLLSIGTSADAGSACVRVCWTEKKTEPPHGRFSGPELGLILAKAGLRRAGVEWKDEQAEDQQLICLRVPVNAGIEDDHAGADGVKTATLPGDRCGKSSLGVSRIRH